MLFIIGVTITDPAKQWVTYRLQNPTTLETLFVGACTMSQLLTGIEWRTNPAYVKGTPVLVSGDSVHDNHALAVRRAGQIVRGLPSVPEMNRAKAMASHLSVVCNETGEIFPNAHTAVKAHDLTVSALSNHLAGKAGYRTVKGKTYSRTAPAPRPAPPVALPVVERMWRAYKTFDSDGYGDIVIAQGDDYGDVLIGDVNRAVVVQAAFEWLKEHGKSDTAIAFKNDYGVI